MLGILEWVHDSWNVTAALVDELLLFLHFSLLALNFLLRHFVNLDSIFSCLINFKFIIFRLAFFHHLVNELLTVILQFVPTTL